MILCVLLPVSFFLIWSDKILDWKWRRKQVSEKMLEETSRENHFFPMVERRKERVLKLTWLRGLWAWGWWSPSAPEAWLPIQWRLTQSLQVAARAPGSPPTLRYCLSEAASLHCHSACLRSQLLLPWLLSWALAVTAPNYFYIPCHFSSICFWEKVHT